MAKFYYIGRILEMKLVYRFLFVLHALMGIGAMGGGMMAILNPQGPGGMPTDALKNSPFSDYLIPGIILFSVIGLGNIFCAVTSLLKLKYQGYISSIFGWALVIWIIVQCIMIQIVVYLHVIFFIIGLVQAFLAFLLLFMKQLFPANIMIHIIIKLEKKFPESSIMKAIGKLERKLTQKAA
jgi:hypothetical protein